MYLKKQKKVLNLLLHKETKLNKLSKLMLTYAINPDSKKIIFYSKLEFNRSYYEMTLTEEQYTSLLDFITWIDG